MKCLQWPENSFWTKCFKLCLVSRIHRTCILDTKHNLKHFVQNALYFIINFFCSSTQISLTFRGSGIKTFLIRMDY